ncbi:MAG: hypothetical protein J6W29_04085 [Neisseriaceae bacterium]|nr:hypothetical protein [Neisseriaceae bacterium]
MKKQHKFALSILTVSLLTATSAMAAGNDSPFSIPLYLTNPAGMSETRVVTETTPVKKSAYIPDCPEDTEIKPNIVLYLDDSGSMTWELGDTRETKVTVLREVISELMNQYGDKANWALEFMNNPNAGLAMGAGASTVNTTVQTHTFSGTTPLLPGYTRAVDKLANIKTNNKYVIALTDGAANKGSVNDINNWLNFSEIGKTLGVTYSLDDYDLPDFAAVNRHAVNINSLSYYADGDGFASDWQYELCSVSPYSVDCT